jgi:hypothetical protein
VVRVYEDVGKWRGCMKGNRRYMKGIEGIEGIEGI